MTGSSGCPRAHHTTAVRTAELPRPARRRQQVQRGNLTPATPTAAAHAQGRHPAVRASAASARHHRPLLDALPRPAHADRRDHAALDDPRRRRARSATSVSPTHLHGRCPRADHRRLPGQAPLVLQIEYSLAGMLGRRRPSPWLRDGPGRHALVRSAAACSLEIRPRRRSRRPRPDRPSPPKTAAAGAAPGSPITHRSQLPSSTNSAPSPPISNHPRPRRARLGPVCPGVALPGSCPHWPGLAPTRTASAVAEVVAGHHRAHARSSNLDDNLDALNLQLSPEHLPPDEVSRPTPHSPMTLRFTVNNTQGGTTINRLPPPLAHVAQERRRTLVVPRPVSPTPASRRSVRLFGKTRSPLSPMSSAAATERALDHQHQTDGLLPCTHGTLRPSTASVSHGVPPCPLPPIFTSNTPLGRLPHHRLYWNHNGRSEEGFLCGWFHAFRLRPHPTTQPHAPPRSRPWPSHSFAQRSPRWPTPPSTPETPVSTS